MFLIPTKKQWKNWSLPSKATLIGTYIGIISFLAFLTPKIIDIISSQKKTTYIKYHRNISQGLLNYANGEFKTAQNQFTDILKTSPKIDLKDIYNWLGESYARNGQFEESFKISLDYYNTQNVDPSINELQYLALQKYYLLINREKYAECYKYVFNDLSKINMSNFDEIKLIACLANGKKDKANEILKLFKFDFEFDEFNREIQFSQWSFFNYSCLTDSLFDTSGL